MSRPSLHLLPERTGGAAENMAIDFLLLRRYPSPAELRLRHYTWRQPAFTFGYAQKIAFVRASLPADETLDITRRPTGGGLVDHRDDWTYALVIPRGHPLFDRPGPTIYRHIHTALADALTEHGACVRLQDRPPETPPGICFQRPERDDIVHAETRRKVAGAALKRTKHGVLLQGSIWRPATPETTNWETLTETFAKHLGTCLEAEPTPTGWPEFAIEEEEALIDQFASTEWIEAR